MRILNIISLLLISILISCEKVDNATDIPKKNYSFNGIWEGTEIDSVDSYKLHLIIKDSLGVLSGTGYLIKDINSAFPDTIKVYPEGKRTDNEVKIMLSYNYDFKGIINENNDSISGKIIIYCLSYKRITLLKTK